MRSYSCYVYHKDTEGKLILNKNSACWAGIQGCVAHFKKDNYNSNYLPTNPDKEEQDIIYFNQFREKETEQYIPLIIKLVNKITSCELVEIDKVEYIRFKLLETYDQSLILLNFIRNLWNGIANPYDSLTKKAGDIVYNQEFFRILEEDKTYKEPLERMTHANIEALKLTKVVGSMGHSNVHPLLQLKIKNVKQLKAYTGTSTNVFLTTI